ncbi:hypothetical protein SAMN05192534_1236 [Alteribacillus persepolensis]|uniref:Uncharacterized protein n=1 Tax=Alteribacillus persepolensis TaxID=568899 RepID=A0A1G8I661_9BACI|nr:hypothetical protein SAMN05192534_1236 [Alteribacillus persepolensis]
MRPELSGRAAGHIQAAKFICSMYKGKDRKLLQEDVEAIMENLDKAIQYIEEGAYEDRQRDVRTSSLGV